MEEASMCARMCLVVFVLVRLIFFLPHPCAAACFPALSPMHPWMASQYKCAGMMGWLALRCVISLEHLKYPGTHSLFPPVFPLIRCPVLIVLAFFCVCDPA
jgi:hypothetical protein